MYFCEKRKMGNPQSKDHCTVDEDFVTVKSYKGETKHDKRHGQGVYLYPNGDMYDGGWRKSRKYGKGVYIYADGHRLEGYFYHDEYIGKEPNEKIKRRMAKKKAHGELENCPATEQSDISNGRLDETTDPEVKLKADGGSSRRVQSMRRNKWLRDKYDIDNMDGSAESLDTAKNGRNRNSEELVDSTKDVKRSFSFGSKKHKNKDTSTFDEAVERRNSKRLRESIRQKYNLPTR